MITSSGGYPGSVTTTNWTDLAVQAFGTDYGVAAGNNNWKVTVAAGDRTVNIAPGSGWGKGVYDVSNATESLQLPSVGSGSRWHLIGAHRDWSTTTNPTGPGGVGRTYFTSIDAGTTPNIPATRAQTGGAQDLQPLFLARVTAGSTSVQELIDVRCWPGNSGIYAHSELVKQYLNRPGSLVTIGDLIYQNRIDKATGDTSWTTLSSFADTDYQNGNLWNRWNAPSSYVIFRRQGLMGELRVRAVNDGGNIVVGNNGDIQNQELCVIPDWYAPKTWWAPLSSGPAGRTATGSVTPDGKVFLSGVGGSTDIKSGEVINLGGIYFAA